MSRKEKPVLPHHTVRKEGQLLQSCLFHRLTQRVAQPEAGALGNSFES
jgi:hypothetical protein